MSLSYEKKLKNLLLKEDVPIPKSNLTHYKTNDYLYVWTNELLKEAFKNTMEEKKVLTVRASGDHAIHAFLNGASEVHLFDVNELSYFVTSLKIKMLKYLDYKDFFMEMDFLVKDKINMVLDKIGHVLDDNEIDFWETYEKFYEEYKYSLFITGTNYTPSNCAYLNRNIFYEVKENLINKKLVNHNVALEDLPDRLDGELFDAIYLSNILGRIERPASEVNDVAITQIKALKPLVKEGGTIHDYALKFGMHGCYKDSEILKDFSILSNTLSNKDVIYTYKKRELLSS